MAFKTKIILALILCLSTACVPVPIPTKVYEPSAEGGILSDSQCGYNQGPGIWDKLKLKFTQGKTILSIMAVEHNEPSIKVHIALSKGVNRDVNYSWKENKITANLEGTEIIVSSIYRQGKRIDITKNSKNWSGFYFYLDPNNNGKFEINLPILFIDGLKKEIPTIKFKPAISWYVITLNC